MQARVVEINNFGRVILTRNGVVVADIEVNRRGDTIDFCGRPVNRGGVGIVEYTSHGFACGMSVNLEAYYNAECFTSYLESERKTQEAAQKESNPFSRKVKA